MAETYISESDIDMVLEQFDQTDQAIQRAVIVRLTARVVALEAANADLSAACEAMWSPLNVVINSGKFPDMQASFEELRTQVNKAIAKAKP